MGQNIVAIVQARSNSARLPRKMLMPLWRSTVIEQVLHQLQYSLLVNQIVVATTEDSDDDELVHLVKKNNVDVFRGHSTDVLERYFRCAEWFKADVIVRITGDCPLLDPAVVDEVISAFLAGSYDFLSNTNPATFPDGMDVEVLSLQALKRAFQESQLLSEREHVTLYIKNSSSFIIGNVCSREDLSTFRWTIDNQEDYIFLTCLCKYLPESLEYISMKDVLSVLERNPAITEINKHISRNEGLVLSLIKDKTPQ